MGLLPVPGNSLPRRECSARRCRHQKKNVARRYDGCVRVVNHKQLILGARALSDLNVEAENVQILREGRCRYSTTCITTPRIGLSSSSSNCAHHLCAIPSGVMAGSPTALQRSLVTGSDAHRQDLNCRKVVCPQTSRHAASLPIESPVLSIR